MKLKNHEPFCTFVVQPKIMMIKIVSFFIFFSTILQFKSQERCEFKYQQKIGGHYLFSTYFEDDLSTKKEGVCQTLSNGKIYEKRVFKNGKLQEEILNYYDFKPRVKTIFFNGKKDSLICESTVYWENGNLQQHSLYYTNKTGRRCHLQTDYHLNGKKRFVNSYAFVKKSELTSEYDEKNHPPHTIDDEGYTYLQVPFGEALTYFENGQLQERIHHKLVLYDSDGYSKNGPFERYSDEGKLTQTGFYKDGHPDSVWIGYNYYGNRFEEQHYSQNMKAGTWKGWHDNGLKKYERTYDITSKHPFQPNEIYWNDQGIKIQEDVMDFEGNGYQKEWDNQGKLLHDLEIVKGDFRSGNEKKWFPNGQLNFIHNRRSTSDTTYLEYYENGQIAKLTTNKKIQDKQQFCRKEWNEKGVLLEQVTQTKGNEYTNFEHLTYYDNANLKAIVQDKNNERIEEYYYKNGQKQKAMIKHHGLLVGQYLELDSLGNILVYSHYSDGIRNGLTQLFKNPNQLVFAQNYVYGCVDKSYQSTLKPAKVIFKNLPKVEQATFYQLAFDQLERLNLTDSNQTIISNQSIDSLAELFYVFYTKWNKKIQFPYTNSKANYPSLYLNLHVSTFAGLLKHDTTNIEVKKIMHLFKTQKWEFPVKWEEYYNNYTAKVTLKSYYTPYYLQKVIQDYVKKGWISYSYRSPNNIESNFKNLQVYYPLTISRLNSCIFRATYAIGNRTVSWLIYPDQSVEFENQAFTWEEIQRIEPIINHMQWE